MNTDWITGTLGEFYSFKYDKNLPKKDRSKSGKIPIYGSKRLGLNDSELAFYDALCDNESAVRDLQEDTLKKIAVELTNKLRNSTTVDWQVRDSVRAKLRLLVKQILRKYKYPPDQQQKAIELVLKQAEAITSQLGEV